jgi:UDPglucose 6-dehydrogenase
MNYDISFIGLGKLGLPLATNMAKNGLKVLAIDINPFLLSTVKKNKAPWVEAELLPNIEEAEKNIHYTDSYEHVANSDITIILVNTPSKEKDGSFSNEYVLASIKSVCEKLIEKSKKEHHFILSSTVMPGSIKNEFIPLIEKITGWNFNKNEFKFSYVPDFVAIGNVIKDFENPDFLLIGANNEETFSETASIYNRILKNNPPVRKLSLSEAELSKVALNAFITTKISFANYLGLLASKIDPNINVDNITNTIGLDKRIGTKYFKAGGAYGGTCFPRDTWAYMKVSTNVGLFADQMAANEKINNMVTDELISEINIGGKKIGLVGLGFKPGTSVTTEGVAAKILSKLNHKKFEISIHDYHSDCYSNLLNDLKHKVEFKIVEDLRVLLDNSDTIILCNGDKKYIESPFPRDLKIIDPWRILN